MTNLFQPTFGRPLSDYINDQQDVLDRESVTYKRATNAGFTFGSARLIKDVVSLLEPPGVYPRTRVQGDFTCVCGRRERYSFFLDICWQDITSDKLDVVHMLEVYGSFSEEHLRQDGYTEEQIKQILDKFNAPTELEQANWTFMSYEQNNPYIGEK